MINRGGVSLWAAIGAISAGVPACGGSADETAELAVWPASINLGLTDDGQFFSMPVGASGGVDLSWKTAKREQPRITITDREDSGALLTAEFAGADELRVTAADGQTVEVPVTVLAYPRGSVERGEAGVERIGCRQSGCHDTSGPDFTPSRIGGFDDRELSAWILQGKSLKTGVMIGDHAWPLSIGEEQDVVAYLRSLPPRGDAVRQ